jgi:periplasmic protein TonB
MEMRRNRKPAIPFFMALVLHAVGAVCAGHLLMTRMPLEVIVPAFRQGESSIELSLLSPASAPVAPQSIVPTTQPAVSIDVPAPIEDHESVPVSVETLSERSVEEVANPDARTEETGVVGSNQPGEMADADVADKGVEGGAYPVSTIKPTYPLGSRLRGEEGSVVLNVKVDSVGEVRAVTVLESSGYSGLDNAAVKAVRQTKFHSALGAGVPCDGDSRMTIRFRLVD